MRPSIARMPRAKLPLELGRDFRRRLDIVVGDRQDVGHGVDQQADDLVA